MFCLKMQFPCLFTLVVSETLIMCAEESLMHFEIGEVEITFVNSCNLTKSSYFGSGNPYIESNMLSLLIHCFFPLYLTCNFILFPVSDFQFHFDMGNALVLVTLSPRNIPGMMLQLLFFVILRCSNFISNLQLTEGLFQHTTRANLHHITLLQDLFFQLYLYHISVPRYTFPLKHLFGCIHLFLEIKPYLLLLLATFCISVTKNSSTC